MFKHFYGLSFNPFDKSISEKDCFISCDHKQMISRLDYLKDVRGIGVFTAPAGMGKSYALRCFAKNLNPNLYQMVYICLSTISVSEFYRQFCTMLGIDAGGRKTDMFKAIQDRIYYLLKEKHKTLLMAVDESQYLNSAIFRDIKMLMNVNYDSLNCFALILAGEPYLNNILEKPIHESLKQRITVHYNYQGLSGQETAEYIYHKIDTAGGARSIIDDAAVNAIAGFCQGTPRLIDNLMTDALTLGAQLKKQSIDAEIILAASNNQSLR